MLLCFGVYVVQERVSDWDYIAATSDRRRHSRLCHINMLKPYLDRDSAPLSPSSLGVKTVLALCRGEPTDQAHVTAALSSADPTEALVASGIGDAEDVVCPSSAVVQERLKNSEMLSKLEGCFPHLTQAQYDDMVSLIKSHIPLFSDVLT